MPRGGAVLHTVPTACATPSCLVALVLLHLDPPIYPHQNLIVYNHRSSDEFEPVF
jgi:hypothetical protein